MSAPRTLLPYQTRWVQDRDGLAVCEKGRRIGLSWAAAYDAVMRASAGDGDVYYQSYSLDQARSWIGDAAEWAQALEAGAGAIGEVLFDADGDRLPAYRIPFPSGRSVAALSSAPRALRGKGRPGDRAIIDEAAWIDDLDAVLKAALAFRMWGGDVRILSTHHGESSPFAALCAELREGRRAGSLHRVPFADAVADGLYRRVCEVTGDAWSPEAEAAWAEGIRAEYGEHAAEELDCEPAPAAGAWLSWDTIRRVEHAEAGDPARYAGGAVCVGVDIARRRDLWGAAALERVGDVHWVRELRVERNIPFSAQSRIVGELIARYRPARVAVDQTGMGEAIVEQWQDTHGRRLVEGVLLTGPRRLDLATALLEAAQDRRLRIPVDDALRADLHAVRAEAGPTGAPRLVAGRDTDGHADRFWALALAVAASVQAVEVYALHRINNHADLRGMPRLGRPGAVRWRGMNGAL